MKHTTLILSLVSLLLVAAPGCSSLAKYQRPGHGPFSATRSGWEAVEYCLYLRDPDPLCSVAQSFVNPLLLPLWVGNLGIALPFDALTLPYDLLAPAPPAEDCSPCRPQPEADAPLARRD